MGDLFGDRAIGDGAMLLRKFACGDAAALIKAVSRVAALAPFRHMVTPGGDDQLRHGRMAGRPARLPI